MSHPSIHPSNHPTNMSAPQTIHLTQSLANDPRAQLEPWLEEIETHARNICAQLSEILVLLQTIP